jgi:hypothetical protein
MSQMWRVCFLCGVAMLAASFASAQSSTSPNPNNPSLVAAGESSSTAFLADSGPGDAMALRSAAAALGSGAGGGQSGGEKHGAFSMSHFAAEAGAGFNAPVGNDTSTGGGGPFITWGGNFTAGAGLHFSKRFTLLGEFQFMDDKLPASLIAEAGDGATSGDAHIISLTADPVIELFPKWANSIYVTGGGGYYHKSTNFNAQVCCDFYGYAVSVNTNSFSSNQAGGNFGLGFTRRLGGVYGDSTMKLFAEARYVYIHTPAITETNGLGTTELIPVTLGFRW